MEIMIIMISENHFLRAKSFLSIYKEALDTLKDSAFKSGYESHAEEFEKILTSSNESKGVVFGPDGTLQKGPALRASYWYRLSDLSQ